MGGETPQPQNFETSQETGMCTAEACSARVDTAEMSVEKMLKEFASEFDLNVQTEQGNERAPNGKTEKTLTYRFTGHKGDVAALTYNEDRNLYTLREPNAKGGKVLATTQSSDELFMNLLPNQLQLLSAA